MDLSRVAHITIPPPRPQGRAGYSGEHFLRVGGGTRPLRTNLCGGEFTDRDFIVREARKVIKAGPAAIAEWNLCPACIALFTPKEAK